MFLENEFMYRSIEASFVFIVVDMHFFTFISVKRVFWAVDTAAGHSASQRQK